MPGHHGSPYMVAGVAQKLALTSETPEPDLNPSQQPSPRRIAFLTDDPNPSRRRPRR
jgi:hypothetical protein